MTSPRSTATENFATMEDSAVNALMQLPPMADEAVELYFMASYSIEDEEILPMQNLIDAFNLTEFTNEDADVGEPRIWNIRSQIFCLETAEELAEEVECNICLSTCTVIDMVETNCSHVFCKNCVCSHLDTPKFRYRTPDCPLCRAPIEILTTKDVEILTELQKYDNTPCEQDPNSLVDWYFDYNPSEINSFGLDILV